MEGNRDDATKGGQRQGGGRGPDDVVPPTRLKTLLRFIRSKKFVALILITVGGLLLAWLIVVLVFGPQLAYYDSTGILRYWILDVQTAPVAILSAGMLLAGLLIRYEPLSRADSQTRRRVDEQVGFHGVEWIEPNIQGDVHVHYPENYDIAAAELAAQVARSSAGLRKQEAILHEIYTQGLVQARVSFTISMTFAALGAILLFTGVGLAVLRADSNGQQYASIVTTLSGAVVSLTSALFFAQANSTRKRMGEQAVLLREESRSERQINASREMIAAVSDESRRNELNASIAARLIELLADTPQTRQQR